MPVFCDAIDWWCCPTNCSSLLWALQTSCLPCIRVGAAAAGTGTIDRLEGIEQHLPDGEVFTASQPSDGIGEDRCGAEAAVKAKASSEVEEATISIPSDGIDAGRCVAEEVTRSASLLPDILDAGAEKVAQLADEALTVAEGPVVWTSCTTSSGEGSEEAKDGQGCYVGWGKSVGDNDCAELHDGCAVPGCPPVGYASVGESHPWVVELARRPTNLETILAHPATLFVYISNPHDHSSPIHQGWVVGGTAHLGCASNSQPVRLPCTTWDDNGRAITGLQHLHHDFAQMCQRMCSGVYQKLSLPSELVEAAGLEEHRDTLGQCMAQLLNRREAIPQFVRDFDSVDLVQEHRDNVQLPDCGGIYLSIMCGISGDGMAFRASGFPEEDMVFIEVCPIRCHALRQRFPRALVLDIDVRSEEAEKLCRQLKGSVAVGFGAIPCQPVSNANRHKRPDDERLKLARTATQLLLSCEPTIVVLEDVASFKSEAPAVFKGVLDSLSGHYSDVREVYLNAKYCMVPQQRNRVFIVAAEDGVDLSPMSLAVEQQKRLRGYKPDSSRTCPTMREKLVEFGFDVKRCTHVFIPHLSGAAKGKDGRPRRCVSLDRAAPTVTSIYGVRGGLSDEAFARYQCCEADGVCNGDKSLVINIGPRGWWALCLWL